VGLRLSLSLVLACALVSAFAPAPASAAARGETMIDTINLLRAQNGLRPLKRSRRLTRSATARAALMMRADFFAHPARLRVPTFDSVGEVIELHPGRRARVVRTLKRWGASPPHQRVLSSRRFRWIGAGRAAGSYRGGRATIWVVRLGRR
jgi:uncharacterized protein YkwD